MEKEFWDIIEQTKSNAEDWESRPEALRTVLSQLTPEKIIQFKDYYYKLLVESYRWDLWGAAYIINGGCSDDAFDYWRDFLISEGEDTYKKALDNVESLAELDDIEDSELEEFRYVMGEVYEEKTGSEFPDFDVNYPSDPIGEQWDEEDLANLFPKLAAKYGSWL